MGTSRVRVCREADVGALVGVFEKWMEDRGTRDLKLLFQDFGIFVEHSSSQPGTHLPDHSSNCAPTHLIVMFCIACASLAGPGDDHHLEDITQ
eukprot:15449955-Alexandrium_andersonii.AAC.1